MTNLMFDTKYYVRAYAINSVGTFYGDEVSFKAVPVYDIDGNGYKSVIIGNQEWMAENLKVTRYNDGTAIPYVTNNSQWSNLSTPAYCYYDNDDVFNKAIYGALYNWYAVNTGKLCQKVGMCHQMQNGQS